MSKTYRQVMTELRGLDAAGNRRRLEALRDELAERQHIRSTRARTAALALAGDVRPGLSTADVAARAALWAAADERMRVLICLQAGLPAERCILPLTGFPPRDHNRLVAACATLARDLRQLQEGLQLTHQELMNL